MNSQLLLTFLLFAFFGFGNLAGQDTPPVDTLALERQKLYDQLTEAEQKEVDEQYGGSVDFYFGIKKNREGDLFASWDFFRKSQFFYKEQNNWKRYGQCVLNRMRLKHMMGKNFESIEEGQEGLKELETQEKEPLTRIKILHNIANGCMSLGMLPKAASNFEIELELLKDLYKMDTVEMIASCANSLGFCYGLLGEYEKAEEIYKRGLNIVESLENCPNCQTIKLRIFNNMGSTYRQMGNFGKAFELLEHRLKMGEKIYGENSLEMLVSYYSLGKAYEQYGQTERAKEYYKKVVYIVNQGGDKIPTKYFVYKVTAEQLLALISIFEKDYELALSYLNSASEDLERIQVPQTSSIIHSIFYAETYRNSGDLANAQKYLIFADSILESLDRVPTVDEKIELLLEYADLYEAKGDFEKAKRNRNKFIKEFSNLPRVSRLYMRENYSRFSDLYKKTGNIDSALHFIQIALQYDSEGFSSKDIADSPEVSQLFFNIATSSILNKKLNLLLAKIESVKTPEDKDKWFDIAFNTVDLVDKFHLEYLKKVNFHRGGESNFIIKPSLSPFRAGIMLGVNNYTYRNNINSLEKAFYYNQKLKAQKLLLTQLNSEAIEYYDLDKSLMLKERDLLAEIHIYQRQLNKAEQEGNAERIEYLKAEKLLKKQEAYQELLREMESKYPDYYEAKYQFKPETAESIQNILQSNELLIEYVFVDSSLYIFTLAQDQPLQVRECLFLQAEFGSKIQSFHQMLQNSAMMRKSSSEKFITLSNEIYNMFIQPIEDQISNKNRLIIIGDFFTNYLPFEVLLKSNETKAFKDLGFLIKEHEISYHYSTTLFAKAKRKEIRNEGGIYAFAPVYDESKDLTISSKASPTNNFNSTLRALDKNGNFAPLPESEKEVKSIFELFSEKNKAESNVLNLRENANEASLKSNLEKPYQFIHIAGHSFADMKKPRFSGIACYQMDESHKEDGTLYTGEIYNINSKADLVTLSSCESGYGQVELTEGIMGLNRAFIYAGTPNVVFSLWKVYDKVSANLMIDFYKNILEGKDYSSSLRAAKLNLLKDEATASPHYWSPYLLIGR